MHKGCKPAWLIALVAGCAAPAYSPPPGALIAPAAPIVNAPPAMPAWVPQVGAAPLLPAPDFGLLANPLLVPMVDRDYAWDQVVDVVDDYFKIAREQRLQQIEDFIVEGQIYTFPQTGATLLEPWRPDSVNFYERLESTLQSIRRMATVRVIPAEGGYEVDVVVLKELEDVKRPAHATAGASMFPYNDSLDRNTEPRPSLLSQIGDQPRPVANPPLTAGWIALGRDTALEQQMLADIRARLGGVYLPAAPPTVGPAEPYYLPPGQVQPGPPQAAPQPPTQWTPITPGPAELPPPALGP